MLSETTTAITAKDRQSAQIIWAGEEGVERWKQKGEIKTKGKKVGKRGKEEVERCEERYKVL